MISSSGSGGLPFFLEVYFPYDQLFSLNFSVQMMFHCCSVHYGGSNILNFPVQMMFHYCSVHYVYVGSNILNFSAQMMFRTGGEEATLIQERGALANRIRLKGGKLIWEWKVA